MRISDWSSDVCSSDLASLESLIEQARPRLRALMQGGATTVEIKSGYGLDTDTELKMLRAAKTLGESEAVRVVPTLLAFPPLQPDYEERTYDYVRPATEQILPPGV